MSENVKFGESINPDSLPQLVAHYDDSSVDGRLDARLYYAEDSTGAFDSAIATGNLNYALLQQRVGSDAVNGTGAAAAKWEALQTNGEGVQDAPTFRDVVLAPDADDKTAWLPATQESQRSPHDSASTNVSTSAGNNG